MKRISIALPDWMFEDLAQRAHSREITITELIRRAVSLDRLLDRYAGSPIYIGDGKDRLQIVTPDWRGDDEVPIPPKSTSNGQRQPAAKSTPRKRSREPVDKAS